MGACYAPRGRVNLAVFAPQAFQPQADLLQQRVARLAGPGAILPWAYFAQPDTLRLLLEEAGPVDVRVHPEQLGYHK